MRNRGPVAIMIVTLAMFALAACAPTVSFPDAPPDAEGIAKGVVPSSEDTITFVLAGYAEGDYFNEAHVTVGPETVVGDSQGRPIDPMALSSGAVVSVWVDVCAESYPVQCTATALRVEQV